MFPGFATNDFADRCVVNVPLTGQSALADSASGVLGADVPNVLLNKSGVPLPFAARIPFRMQAISASLADGGSPFCLTILYVILLCSKPQMIGVATCGIVASMMNLDAARDWPVHHRVSNTVGKIQSASNPELPVSELHLGTFPVPAFGVSFTKVNFVTEPFKFPRREKGNGARVPDHCIFLKGTMPGILS